MKIIITDGWANGEVYYNWVLYDGPDGIDERYGREDTLEECIEKISSHRAEIAQSYLQ